MMIIHILVDTSQVLTGDEDINAAANLNILYDQQQIYLHLLLQITIVQTFIKTS